jgi:ABC-2 type transport system permease protein
MREVAAVFRRDFAAYFATPVAAVFLSVFLVLAAALPFQLGRFYELGQADLATFFAFHPWLYLFFVPAVAMRLWAEERKSGTLELLLTLPLSTAQAVAGKFLAAWTFVGLALTLTFPMWITVNYLGEPDNGAILAAYAGSFLMAGGFLAIGSCLSAATRSQVVAYVLSVAVGLLLLLAGHDLVLAAVRAWAPAWLVDSVAALSFLTHFQAIARGVLDLADLLYFVLTIALWLAATAIVLDRGRSR